MTNISIVVPTHRRPVHLEHLLEAVANQTYPSTGYEIIVIATEGDAAFDIVRRFQTRTKVPIRCSSLDDDPTGGRSASAKRNYGVELASGEWIAFTDDDCVPDSNWLAAASMQFGTPGTAGVEGRTIIPITSPPTLTYRGLLQLTHPGGYQTCNMFYRREVFNELGGFDTRFPFYLEDTDFAWTMLDARFEIAYANDAIVTHPVQEPAPLKLWADANRTGQLALLRAKHREQFRASGTRILTASHRVYLGWYAALFLVVVTGVGPPLWMGFLATVLLVTVDATRLFRGCRVTLPEVGATAALLPVVPIVRAVRYGVGRFRYRDPHTRRLGAQ